MKKSYTMAIISIVVVAIIIITPFFLDYCIYSNDVPSNLTNDQWASFLGSYLGSCIGALTTLIVMYITLRENRKERLEEKKLECRCYLDLSISKSISGLLKEKNYFSNNAKILQTSNYEKIVTENVVNLYKNKGIEILELKNYGPGIIRDMQVSIYNTNGDFIIVYINRVLQDELIYIPIVYDNSDKICYGVESINIIFKSLVNEFCIINKRRNSNDVTEEIKYIDCDKKINDYTYKNQVNKWTNIDMLNNF